MNQDERDIADLQALEQSGGWAIVRRYVEATAAKLSRSVVTKRDPITGAAVDDAACDALRQQIALLESFGNSPSDLIAALKTIAPSEDGLDPYPRP